MIAQFRVLDGKVVKTEYDMEYGSAKELHTLFHEARQAWAEYHVEAETPTAILSYSHTYAEQVKMELAASQN